MASLNKVFLMGNLTRDPDLKYTSGGMAICKLGLAVNRKYLSRSGEEVEEVCFVDVDVFGKQAESTGNYLKKGSPALIEGRLRLDSWDDRNTGEKRSRLMVVAERVQFIGGPSRSTGFGDGDQQQQPYRQAPARPPQPQQPSQPATFRPQPANQPSAPPPMPAFDASGLDNSDDMGGDDDIPDQIPF